MPITVAGNAHRQHAPSEVYVGGELVPPLETPERVDALLRGVRLVGWPIHGPREFPVAAVEAVHDRELIEHLRSGWNDAQDAGWPPQVTPDVFPHQGIVCDGLRGSGEFRRKMGELCFDCSSPLTAGTWIAAKEAADVSLTAAECLLIGRERVAYALCRPPGHHAGPRVYGGYCYLNNAAVAAHRLASEQRPVAILDIDIHHGNGTQAVFYDDPDVLTVSVHEHPEFGYPYYTGYPSERGNGPGIDHNLNVTLGRGCVDDVYGAALEAALARIESFASSCLVVSLGLDGLAEDPTSEARLTPRAYAAAGAALRDLNRPTLVIQEGGYAQARVPEALARFLAAIEGL